MENRLAAERLYSHIITNYGIVTASNFRALCSLKTFRHLVTSGKIPNDMLSVENILAKHHATTLRRDKFNAIGTLQFQHGGELFNVRDDKFGTVAGAIQDTLVATYPAYAHLSRTPVVQMGGGINVADVIADFDRAGFEANFLPVLGLRADYHDSVASYHKHAALVTPEAPLTSIPYMLLFESVHAIFRKLRNDKLEWLVETIEKNGKENNMQREELPVAKGLDVVKLMEGERLASYHCKAGIKPGVKLALEDLYADSGAVFEVSTDGNTLRAFVFNPFSYIKSEPITIPTISYVDAAASNAEQHAEDQCAAAEVGVVDDEEALKHAKGLMRKYLGKKLLKLSEDEKIEAQYGSEKGAELAASFNDKTKRGFMHLFKLNEKVGVDDWLRTVAQFLAERFDEGHDVLLPLAQGMAYCRANLFRYKLTDHPPTITRIG